MYSNVFFQLGLILTSQIYSNLTLFDELCYKYALRMQMGYDMYVEVW